MLAILQKKNYGCTIISHRATFVYFCRVFLSPHGTVLYFLFLDPSCVFVAQENGCTINSGWFMIKNNHAGSNLALKWLNMFKKYYNIWQSDQGSLNELILHYANTNYNGSCASNKFEQVRRCKASHRAAQKCEFMYGPPKKNFPTIPSV
jgi:hypothetical protein